MGELDSGDCSFVKKIEEEVKLILVEIVFAD